MFATSFETLPLILGIVAALGLAAFAFVPLRTPKPKKWTGDGESCTNPYATDDEVADCIVTVPVHEAAPYGGYSNFGTTFGRQVVDIVGTSVRLAADANPEAKVGGVTLDWTTVTPYNGTTNLILNDTVTIFPNQQYVRYGQVLNLITGGEISNISLTGAPTGGTFNVTVSGQNTPPIGFGVTTGVMAGFLSNLTTVGAGNVTVTGSTGGPWFASFAPALGPLAVSAANISLVNGTAPGAAVIEQSAGGRTGLYGPYDNLAVDGRQNLVLGNTCLVDVTVKMGDLKSNHPPVLVGGNIFLARLIANQNNTPSYTNGPNLTTLLSTLTRLNLVQNVG